jgi:EF hand
LRVVFWFSLFSLLIAISRGGNDMDTLARLMKPVNIDRTVNSPRSGFALAALTLMAAFGLAGGALAQQPPAHESGFVMQPTAGQVDAPRSSVTPQRVSSKSIDAAFDRADRDGDGRLSRQEAEHFPALAQRFEQIDLNRDAFISREEFNSAVNN